MSNQVDLQAKEIAERVNQKFKDVKRGDGGRFAKKSANGVIEPVTAKGGRKILMSESDSEPEPTMKRKQNKKAGASSATKTGTTPPSSPRKRQTPAKAQQLQWRPKARSLQPRKSQRQKR